MGYRQYNEPIILKTLDKTKIGIILLDLALSSMKILKYKMVMIHSIKKRKEWK